MTTIRDLAKSCGVSVATVSRAFSPDGKINAATRERILKKAAELQYVPNTIARSLRSRRTGSVGILVPEITNSFYYTVIRQMGILYREKGYHLVIAFCQNDVLPERDMIEKMAACRVDALIFSPGSRESERTLHRCFPKGNVLQLFRKSYEEYPSLIIDDIGGTAEATEYLIARGHRRILYCGEPLRSPGYTGTMKRHGLPTEGLFFPDPFLTEEKAAALLTEARPTAVLAIATCSGKIISALQRLGLRVPEEISLIAYDDVEWTGMLGITTVSHPLDRIAAGSAELLLDGLDGERRLPAEHRMISPFLTVRSSVCDLCGKG